MRAAVAPRAVRSLEGISDTWANPLGTQYMYLAAQPVFDLLGVPDFNMIHYRPGGHTTTKEDWEALLDAADHVFEGKPLPPDMNKLPFPKNQPALSPPGVYYPARD